MTDSSSLFLEAGADSDATIGVGHHLTNDEAAKVTHDDYDGHVDTDEYGDVVDEDNIPELADITAASLLAPLACPAQHPVYGERAYQEGMRAALQEWEGRPGIAWVRRLYATRRGAMKGGVFLMS